MSSKRYKNTYDYEIYKKSLENSYKEINTKPNFNGISYMSIEEIRRFIDEKRIDDRLYLSRVVSNDNSGKSQIRINISASFVGGNCRIDKVDSDIVGRSRYDDCKNVVLRI